jgi:hypothetical protein
VLFQACNSIGSVDLHARIDTCSRYGVGFLHELMKYSWLARNQRWVVYIASVMSPVDYAFLFNVFDIPAHERDAVENAVAQLQAAALQHSYRLGTPKTREQLVNILITYMLYAQSTDYLDAAFPWLSGDEQARVLVRAHELVQMEISGKWKRFVQKIFRILSSG